MTKCYLCGKIEEDDDDEYGFGEVGNILTVTIGYMKEENIAAEYTADLTYCPDCFKYAQLKAEFLIAQLLDGKPSRNKSLEANEPKETGKKQKKKEK